MSITNESTFHKESSKSTNLQGDAGSINFISQEDYDELDPNTEPNYWTTLYAIVPPLLTSTLTVGNTGNEYGFNSTAGFGTLVPASFNVEGNIFTVEAVQTSDLNNITFIYLTPDVEAKKIRCQIGTWGTTNFDRIAEGVFAKDDGTLSSYIEGENGNGIDFKILK